MPRLDLTRMLWCGRQSGMQLVGQSQNSHLFSWFNPPVGHCCGASAGTCGARVHGQSSRRWNGELSASVLPPRAPRSKTASQFITRGSEEEESLRHRPVAHVQCDHRIKPIYQLLMCWKQGPPFFAMLVSRSWSVQVLTIVNPKGNFIKSKILGFIFPPFCNKALVILIHWKNII